MDSAEDTTQQLSVQKKCAVHVEAEIIQLSLLQLTPSSKKHLLAMRQMLVIRQHLKKDAKTPMVMRAIRIIMVVKQIIILMRVTMDNTADYTIQKLSNQKKCAVHVEAALEKEDEELDDVALTSFYTCSTIKPTVTNDN